MAIDEWLAVLRSRGDLSSGQKVREALLPIFGEWLEDGWNGARG